jgi:ribose/xylose/arabinose/galactoside ABC-type transport system permease subunit
MRNWISPKVVPLIATALVCCILYAVASWRYEYFFTFRNAANILGSASFIGVIAVGMTFVILSGGIDLSVGSVMALTAVLTASLVERHHVDPRLAIVTVLLAGAAIGFAMGCIIHFFRLAPFLVTLGGMFFARGLANVITLESISIKHEFFGKLSDFAWSTESFDVHVPSMVFLAVVVIASALAHWTRFGRNVYAIGGSEPSASLMGLPVGRTKILVYTLSGFCAALGGVLNLVDLPSGDPGKGVGLELDAIAAAVIGGTLLSGGVGYVAGTFLGVIILAVIDTAVTTFETQLDSWWTRVAIGALLFLFILLQKIITGTTGLRRQLQA